MADFFEDCMRLFRFLSVVGTSFLKVCSFRWLPPKQPHFLWPPFQWKERISIYCFEIVISQQQSIFLVKFIAWDNMANSHVRTTIYKESWEKLFTLKDDG